MRNLTRSIAANADKVLSDVLDRAYLEVGSGAYTHDEAVYSAVSELTDKLPFVVYPGEHKDHIDVAVRRAVRTGVNKTCCDMQLDLAREMDSDLVQVPSHLGARPSHAEWQGQIFSISGKNKKYRPFSDTGYGTGDGLGGWNCRHSFYPYFEGLSVSSDMHSFTDAENKEYYELTQKQRALERNIRKSKRQLAAMEAGRSAANTPELKEKFEKDFLRASFVLKNREKKLDEFCRTNHLAKEGERVRVVGFGKSVSQKAVWAVRKSRNKPPTRSSGFGGGSSVSVTIPGGTNGGIGKSYSPQNISQKGLTNNMIGGKIEEKEYNVPYGKHSVDADMNKINSEEYAAKFKNATDNEAVNKTLLECSRSAIKHRTGTYFEDMYIINAETGEIMGYQLESACAHGVNYNDSIENALKESKEKKIPIIALHNHPEGYPPSIDDFNKAYDNNYIYGFVAGHNEQVYRYKNNIAHFDNVNDIQADIVLMYKGGTDVDRAYITAYKGIDITYDILRGDDNGDCSTENA